MPAAGAAPTTLQPSRPTIKLGGRESSTLAQGLLAMRIEESTDGIGHCELAVGNWGPVGGAPTFLYFDRTDVDFGKDLEILLSDDSLFKGRVTALEAGFPEGSPPTITLLAEDRLQDLRMTRRTRTFTQRSD